MRSWSNDKSGPRFNDEFDLTDRERQVLELRFLGLYWADMARKMGLSRNRVKQIKKQLQKKGMLTPKTCVPSKKGREAVNAKELDPSDPVEGIVDVRRD